MLFNYGTRRGVCFPTINPPTRLAIISSQSFVNASRNREKLIDVWYVDGTAAIELVNRSGWASSILFELLRISLHSTFSSVALYRFQHWTCQRYYYKPFLVLYSHEASLPPGGWIYALTLSFDGNKIRSNVHRSTGTLQMCLSEKFTKARNNLFFSAWLIGRNPPTLPIPTFERPQRRTSYCLSRAQSYIWSHVLVVASLPLNWRRSVIRE